jgi:hypothetical protein
MSAEPRIAVIVDFEDLAIDVRDLKSGDLEPRRAFAQPEYLPMEQTSSPSRPVPLKDEE